VGNKTALITGITGQDGAFLARFLIQKGYKVIGTSRSLKESNLFRLEYLGVKEKVNLLNIDLTNQKIVSESIEEYKPDEIYNLAAQSSVGLSFKTPLDTFHYNTISVTNLLESIRVTNKNIKFYQASSSEMFGNVSSDKLPIRETLHFNPASPYGVSKASAHWLTVNYRESYNLYTCCGILFNHESCLRGDNFVVKKIINTALKIKSGEDDTLTLGNLTISRDWGYAPKYVEAMWKMLQMEQPDDYVICSSNNDTLQNLVVKIFEKLDLDLNKHLRFNQKYMRPSDLSIMYGDNSKARTLLDWDYDLTTNNLIDLLIKDEYDYTLWLENRNRT